MKARHFPKDASTDGADPPNFRVGPHYPLRVCQIGQRISPPKPKESPGPGQYTIDRSLGQQSCQFHKRLQSVFKDFSPGPKYDTRPVTGADTRHFSLRSRVDPPEHLFAAKYEVLPSVIGDDSPRWSLSSRHAEPKIENLPGPSYIPPALGSRAPKPALASRVDPPRHPDREPPGSGTYNTRKDGNDGLKFTMKQRRFMEPEKDIPGPGPGKYSTVGKINPRGQILTRWDERKREPGLGYGPRPPADTGLKFTIGKRLEGKIIAGCRV
jgi:hypothetical protein